jgi:uncharacterized membrane protein
METLYQVLQKIQEYSPLSGIQESMQPVITNLHEITAGIPLALQLVATAIWSAIPFIESDAGVLIAVLAGVPVIPATIAAIIGNLLAVVAVVVGTDKIRMWLKDHSSKKKQEKRQTKVRRAIEKYGVPGASLLGPLLVGTHLNAFFMAAAGVNRRYLLTWQTIAIIVWAVIFAIVANYIMSIIQSPTA